MPFSLLILKFRRPSLPSSANHMKQTSNNYGRLVQAGGHEEEGLVHDEGDLGARQEGEGGARGEGRQGQGAGRKDKARQEGPQEEQGSQEQQVGAPAGQGREAGLSSAYF